MKTFMLSLLAFSILDVYAGTLEKDLNKIGLKPVITKLTHEKLKSLSYPQDQYFLIVKLGKITQSQYESMMKRYGNHSLVPYQADREYELLDFLPPLIQALSDKTFESSSEMVISEDPEISFIFKNGITVASNCYNTTVEIIRSINSPDLKLKHRFFIPGRWEISEVIADKKYGIPVTGAIQPMDVLYYSAGNQKSFQMVQHSAIYLSDDLVFEKTDSSSADPYRISYLKDVKSKYAKLIPEMFKYHKLINHRFGGKGKELFPDLKMGLENGPFSGPEVIQNIPDEVKKMNLSVGCETGMGGGCDTQFNNVLDSNILINKETGRAEIVGSSEVKKRITNLR